MTETSLVYRSAGELAALMRSGQVTAVQVVQAHLQQIDAWNPQLDAVVSRRDAEALAEAEAADAAQRAGQPLGRLHGVPITLKDSLRVGGVISTFGGLPPYARHRPRADCQVVARLRQAGAIVLGRTNLPLFALNWQCDNPFFKEGKNPWDLTRTPGGSSGGSAAALAAGFAPLEVGTDLGGSIRYPAHCCGVLGLRTTVGRLPIDDIGPEGPKMSFHRLLSVGPMARSLADLALALDVMLGDGESPAAPPAMSAGRLRIAVTPSLPGAEPDAATAAQIDALCRGLREDGHEVEIGAAPDVDLAAAWRLWGTIAGYELWSGMPFPVGNALTRALFTAYALRRKLGDGPVTQHLGAGLACSRRGYEEALAEQAQILGRIDEFFSRYACWILPVAMGEAIRRQAGGAPIQDEGRRIPYTQYLGAYTVPTTLFETPALALPLGLGRGGLPIAVQVHAARGADRALLDLAQRALAKYCAVHIPPGYAR